MASKEVHTLRWGILGSGWIAGQFTKDLLIDPATRDVTDVKHEIVAVGSRAQDKADKFCKDFKIPDAKAYGSYEDLVKAANVEIVYIASPHSEHFKHTMLCLEAGKHVLCEKAFTVNAAQAQILVDTAKQKKLFLMEAQWTRFFPMSTEIRSICSSGKLGHLWRVTADLSFGDEVETEYADEHRMVNPDLAGGALLDLGLYPTLWVFQILYHTSAANRQTDPKVVSMAVKYRTGVDQLTDVIIRFADDSRGLASTNLRVSTNPDGHHSTGPAIKIQGTHGEIVVPGPAFRPTSWTRVTREPGAGGGPSSRPADRPLTEHHQQHFPGGGQGFYWEADECARCVRDGRLESEVMPHAESVAMMKVFDQVRQQNDLKYPDGIETTNYKQGGWLPSIGAF